MKINEIIKVDEVTQYQMVQNNIRSSIHAIAKLKNSNSVLARLDKVGLKDKFLDFLNKANPKFANNLDHILKTASNQALINLTRKFEKSINLDELVNDIINNKNKGM